MLRIPFVLLINLYNLLRWVLSQAFHALARAFRKKRQYVEIAIASDYPFGQGTSLFQYFRSKPTFLQMRRDIKTVSADPDVDGVVVMVRDTISMGAARTGQLIEWLDTVRGAGKHVVAHSDMAMTRDYLVCTVGDDILMTPAGSLYTFGPRFDQYFLAEAFERHGISAQFIRIGAFKAASNRFLHREMPTPQRVMMEDLHRGYHTLQCERVASRRDMPVEQVPNLHRRAPASASVGRQLGFLDGEAFSDDLARWLEHREEHTQLDRPFDGEFEIVDLETYKNRRPRELNWKPLLRRKPRLAVIDLSGLIIMPGMNLPGGALAVDPTEVLPLLRRIRNDRRYAGLLVHINSPGGSALASDQMWKALEEVRAQKPVVAFCSDVAASGGYYLAVAADRIFCRPETITGSIGVIRGKMSGGDGLRHLGVNVESIYDDPSATFTSLFEPISDELWDNLREDTRAFYCRFLQRVGHARKLPRRRLHRYARGRVYLGQQAFDRGLVDGVGGFEQALDALIELVNETAKKPVVTDRTALDFLPHRKQSLKDLVRPSLIEMSEGFGLQALEPLLKPLTVAALMRRDPMLALLPWTFDFDSPGTGAFRA